MIGREKMGTAKVKSAQAHEGESREYRGCDGYPAGFIVPRISIVLEDGRQFWHTAQRVTIDSDEDGFAYPKFLYSMEEARTLASRIEAKGVVDLKYWAPHDTRTLEEKWETEAMWERKERDETEGPGWRLKLPLGTRSSLED
jgi:hypothetical protein